MKVNSLQTSAHNSLVSIKLYLCGILSLINDKKIMEVKDSNGNILSEGDSVTVIKDLKVRGTSTVIKRGTKVKNIRLTDDEDEVEGKVEGSVMVLRVEFLKKV